MASGEIRFHNNNNSNLLLDSPAEIKVMVTNHAVVLIPAILFAVLMPRVAGFLSPWPFLKTAITAEYALDTQARQFSCSTERKGHFHFLSILSAAESKKRDDNTEQQTTLTPEKVAEMVEVAFVNGVMQLAQGYVDVLKLFIVAVQSGYSLEMPPKSLLEAVAACPVQSANRPLMDEEIQLRTTWIQLVYLVLDFVKYESKSLDSFADSEDIDPSIRGTYANTIPILARTKEHGLPFDSERVKECSNAVPDNINMDDPMEKAIVSQSLRVIWLTLVVLDEEEQCAEDKEPIKPQPPIPGAFD